MTHIKRIGYACKWLDDATEVRGMKVNAANRELNGRCTTMRWLREHPTEAEQRQYDLMNHNTAAAIKQIERVASLPPERRMMRIGSEMLSGYTEKDWIGWWQHPDQQRHCERIFAPVGEAARKHDVRISFHPGQFCVLASEAQEIRDRSILEFEYHADLARGMGFGKTLQDMKINVHISGKQGPAGIRESLKKLSPEARNCITIENDEMSWGVDASIELVNDCALVLDLHHHWIRTGEYMNPTDDRVKRIIDSWRGVRPVCHYSVSREDVLVDHATDVMPDHVQLLAQGYKKQKMRAHSDWYWNQPVTDWALSFWEHFDLMCESKGKNLSSAQVYNRALELNLV